MIRIFRCNMYITLAFKKWWEFHIEDSVGFFELDPTYPFEADFNVDLIGRVVLEVVLSKIVEEKDARGIPFVVSQPWE